MIKGHVTRSRAILAAVTLLLLFLSARLLYRQPTGPRWIITQDKQWTPSKLDPDLLPCQHLPGRDDVVVVMRTGATEIADKLPAHLNTTFRCYKDFLIFSDYEETFQDHAVHDVLSPMKQEFIESNPDFGLYLRLLQYGRASLRDDELSGQASFEGGKGGKPSNPGWALDKFKFVPMLNETLQLRPDKQWFVFVESDSYPVYSNILLWLQTRDPAKPLYIGSENQIGPDQFAHGGSVFVMSRPAMEIGAQYYADHEDELNHWAANHWAGDCVLGKTLRDAGVPLTWGWPLFQGGHPEKMDFTAEKADRKLWCTPALSFHHFAPGELQKMWQFEQSWIQAWLDKAREEKRWAIWNDYSDILEYRDVFKNLVLPKIKEDISGFWDNLSPDLVENELQHPFDYCKHFCESQTNCLQFLSTATECKISTKEVMLGEPGTDTQSGWMKDRIAGWVDVLDHCSGFEGWPVD